MDAGVENVEICESYGLTSSTVSILLKNKDKLMGACDQNKTDYKLLKECSIGDLDEALLKWMKVQRRAE